LRFVDRTAPKLASFEAVKNKLIEEERERLKKQRLEQFLGEVRGSKTVVTHTDNVESYVVKVDVNGAPQEPQAKDKK
jgi:hypothetical protein